MPNLLSADFVLKILISEINIFIERSMPAHRSHSVSTSRGFLDSAAALQNETTTPAIVSHCVCVCVCVCVFPRRSRRVSRSRYRSSACALCVRLIVLALARAAISIPPAGRRRKGQPRPCLREKEGWREEKDGASRRATTIGLSWIRLSLLPVIVAPAFVVRAPKRFEWKTSRMNYGCSGRGCRASGRINTDAAV